MRFLELEVARNATHDAAQAAEELAAVAGQCAAHATGVGRGKLHARRHDEVGRLQLALAHVGAGHGFAAGGQGALFLQVVHGHAALDDGKAARLLDHDAQQRHRRTEAIALQLGAAGALVFRHGDGAQAAFAFFDLAAGVLCLGWGCARRQDGGEGQSD